MKNSGSLLRQGSNDTNLKHENWGHIENIAHQTSSTELIINRKKKDGDAEHLPNPALHLTRSLAVARSLAGELNR
jgi:hypothetical protein